MTIPLKIIMTSSAPLEMPENVSFHSILLKDAGWGNVIRSIAEERVLQIVNERPVWKDSQEAIIKKLCSGEYTYLYVILNLDVLAHSKIPSTKDALNQQLMAPTLSIEKVFDTMVSGLDDVEPAKQALNWIFHAIRPLTVSELAVALTLKPDPLDHRVDKQLTFDILIEKVSWDLMRDLGGLLETTVRIVNDRVYFAHHTFHDYLKKHSNLLIPNFHASITEWCLSYLSLCSEYTPEVSLEYDSLGKPHIGVAAAFLKYTDLYWTEHYKLAQQNSSAQESDEAPSLSEEEKEELPLDEKGEQSPVGKKEQPLNEKVAQFLTSDSASLKKWAEKCTQTFGWKEDLADDPLFLASQLGLRRIVHHILQDEALNTQERVEKAAIIAARTGNTDILEDLLKAANDSALIPTLRAAAEYGHTAVIELLLAKISDAGIETPKPEEDTDSPLLLAASNGHIAAFEVLLSNGYSMEALDASKNTTVHLASQLGDVNTLQVMKKLRDETFKSLLKSTNDSDMSPLQLACVAGSIDAFELVRDNSPDGQLHLAKGDSLSPIQLAAAAGHAMIVERLITGGADVTVGSHLETPLRLAARNGHYDVVCCLVKELEKLAVNVEYPESTDAAKKRVVDCLETSLLDAINYGRVKVTEFLLSNTQRNPEADREYIRRAVEGGHLDIVEILTAKTPAKLPDDKYNNIMDIAIRENFVDIVSYLVSEGVTPQWDGYESSIHYAASLGYTLCLRELLRKANDKDVRRRDSQSRTALEVAANLGQLETFKELLTWESDHVVPDQPWRPLPRTLILAIKSPTNSTSKWTKVDLVNFLLDHGWTPNLADGSPDIPLHAAVEDDDIDMVQLLLKKTARINAINQQKQTALHIAAQFGRTEIAGILLENGANPNLIDSDDLTALHVAIKGEDNESVRVLLGLDIDANDTTEARSRADVEQEAPDGSRALHFASNSSTITSTLLELDPKPQLNPIRKASKATPLILAASGGSDDVVLLLLIAGADANAIDSEERTALHHAARRDEERINTVRYLIENKANPNARMADQSTPLYAAVRKEHDKIASYLLGEAKADPDIYGGTLHSPLQAATLRGELDISTRLLKAGANPNAEGGLFGSPLHAAMKEGNLDLIKLLLSEECKANATLSAPPFGTPLHVLSALGLGGTRPSREIAALLLEYDADMINSKFYDNTPLMHAMPEEESLILLDLGADPNIADETGATALHYAAAFHPLSLVQKLLDHDAKVDIRDRCKRSVLYFAALSSDEEKFKAVLDRIPLAERKTHLSEVVPAALKMGSEAIFELLIKEEGIDLNVPDHSGWTGLDVARCYEMLEEADALRALGAKNGSAKGEPTEWCFEDKEGSIMLSDDKMEVWIDGVEEGTIIIPFPTLTGQEELDRGNILLTHDSRSELQAWMTKTPPSRCSARCEQTIAFPWTIAFSISR
jgi:cytohesin